METHAPTPNTAQRKRFAQAKDVTLKAHVDFVTVETPCRITLPRFDGKLKWPKAECSACFTLHDPSERDLVVLAREFGDLRIAEIEVFVDFKPRPSLRGTAGSKVIETIMVDVFASCLAPSRAAGVSERFRAYYRHIEEGRGKVHPFNFKLPLPTDQQLNGGRCDGVQVKAYYKRTDNHRRLDERQHVARLEVAFRGLGPANNDLATCKELLGFRFRKQLMPLFRHVRAASVRRPKRAHPALNAVYDHVDREHANRFARMGCGPFVVGGDVNPEKVRLLRHTEVNNRIGQALLRLEQRIAEAARANPDSCISTLSQTADGQYWRAFAVDCPVDQ
jgi:hypothetical protein